MTLRCPPSVLAAPDKFRGTATAADVAAAMVAGAEHAGFPCLPMPLADGGEGTVEAFGGPTHTTLVTGPLGVPVEATWRRQGDLAVLEMAAASGLVLAGGKQGNDPIGATTRGTGEVIVSAIEAGVRKVIVAVGGSATTDGGLGAAEVLAPLAPLDGSRGYEVWVAHDVCTGFLEAAEVYGPQKGADPGQVEHLRTRLHEAAAMYQSEFGVDVTKLAGAGAGGGLGGGLAALGASLVGGFELIAEELGLLPALASADVVLTGEGRVDATSFQGKVVGSVLGLARRYGRKALVVAGEAASEVPPDVAVCSLVEMFGAERALEDTLTCIEVCVSHLLRSMA